VLRIGLLLDNTGDQSFLNAAELAGAKLALNQINAIGGLKGKPVELLPASPGTDTAAQATGYISGHADVVIGPTDSANAPAAIDVLSKARTPLVSPANTASVLTDYPSGGYYFRTQPADVMQAPVLARLAKKAGGKVAVVHEEGSYGSAVGSAVVEELKNADVQVAADVQASGDAAATAATVKDSSPDAVVVIARGGAQSLLAALAGAGVPGSKLILSDGATATYGTGVAGSALKDARGILPGAFPSQDFQEALLKIDSSLKDLTYAAETYDAVNLAALAASAADDDGGPSIAANLIAVSGGEVPHTAKGQDCATFPECVGLLKDGKSINYQGKSGPVDFDGHGDVTGANYTVFTYGADNKPVAGANETSP
jgi:branched-chain amino acid transport system substrate-binding protein